MEVPESFLRLRILPGCSQRSPRDRAYVRMAMHLFWITSRAAGDPGAAALERRRVRRAADGRAARAPAAGRTCASPTRRSRSRRWSRSSSMRERCWRLVPVPEPGGHHGPVRELVQPAVDVASGSLRLADADPRASPTTPARASACSGGGACTGSPRWSGSPRSRTRSARAPTPGRPGSCSAWERSSCPALVLLAVRMTSTEGSPRHDPRPPSPCRAAAARPADPPDGRRAPPSPSSSRCSRRSTSRWPPGTTRRWRRRPRARPRHEHRRRRPPRRLDDDRRRARRRHDGAVMTEARESFDCFGATCSVLVVGAARAGRRGRAAAACSTGTSGSRASTRAASCRG